MIINSKAKTTKIKDDTPRLRELIKMLKGSYVTVGLHEDAGSYDDGTSVAQVGLWNEFGTETSPQRSFFRSALDEHADKINSWREEALYNILEKGWTPEKALSMVGFRMVVLIQNKIKSNVPPPNAPSTVAEKQRTGVSPKSGFKPGFESRTGTLIDSGLMLRSVTYRVYIRGQAVAA